MPLAAATASLISAAISAGASLTGTTVNGLMNSGHRVICAIEIENWTRFPLIDAFAEPNYGTIHVPPTNVLPSKKEAMVARKTDGLATGSSGTVSWLLEGLNRRVVVMWSAPFNFDHHSNWLGVGITRNGNTNHGDGWFDKMYYDNSGYALKFTRKDYYYTVETIYETDEKIQITGTMGQGHNAPVKITVQPVDESDLAAPLKVLLAK